MGATAVREEATSRPLWITATRRDIRTALVTMVAMAAHAAATPRPLWITATRRDIRTALATMVAMAAHAAATAVAATTRATPIRAEAPVAVSLVAASRTIVVAA